MQVNGHCVVICATLAFIQDQVLLVTSLYFVMFV